MGILKQIPKPKFQTLKETQKTKVKHKISKTTKTHQPAHSPQNNLKHKTANMWISVQHTHQCRIIRAGKDCRREKPEGTNGQDTAERGHSNAEKHDVI